MCKLDAMFIGMNGMRGAISAGHTRHRNDFEEAT